MADLAARIAAARAERAPLDSLRRPTEQDRAEALARWFGARLEVLDGGAVVVVERRIGLAPVVAEALTSRLATAYVDTETTGLSTGAGTVAFLIAIGQVERSQLVVRQYLLPDYPHEPALLRRVAAALSAVARLVTYNGRGFDLPLLVARLTVNGLFAELSGLPAEHDDLLPVARRLWRRVLGSARLAAVEAGVLGVARAGDCPSSEVPMRYFGYLRGGGPDLLAAVLDHNFQDVASLALLDAEIVRLLGGGWETAGLLDRRGMALELARHGDPEAAVELLVGAAASADPAEATALRRLAGRLLLAGGHPDRAEALWREATRGASVEAAAAWIEVARLRERRNGDLSGALEACVAASRVLDLAFALGRGGGMADIARARLRVESRRRRLSRWVAAAERRAGRRGVVAA